MGTAWDATGLAWLWGRDEHREARSETWAKAYSPLSSECGEGELCGGACTGRVGVWGVSERGDWVAENTRVHCGTWHV